MKNVHFSSQTDDWATPQEFFNQQAHLFNFALDVCASPANAKCARYFTKEVNGLTQDWNLAAGGADVWMNPPYGRGVAAWVKKAYETGAKGNTVVCLLPARTDTAWWHDYCMKGSITFIRGRLKFGGNKNSAPFPSALVVFYRSVCETGEGTK